ncbi:CDP-alcohol phosphatidyltransferase family protein [Demequina aestuarii]|uniref:CDP-alcohol phosphatidyltransferase family protein n=1 Tax=Demequina aestuarii TaxID=327095 RepID=UPI000783967B|nr:CDP-alcohol phosphatidyltransferase family protein [Demequina aestuarii]
MAIHTPVHDSGYLFGEGSVRLHPRRVVDPARIDVPLDTIRAVGQPPAIRGRATAEHWSASLYWRKVSPRLTQRFLAAGLSADAVTVGVILTGWMAALSLLIPSIAGPLLAAVFAQSQMLVDASDGEVARVRGTSGPRGVFLDKIAHYTTEGLIPITLGASVAISMGDVLPLALGALLGSMVLMNKLLNDAVHVARGAVGMPNVPDSHEAREIGRPLLRLARKAFNLVPLHRVYHSVEMTHLILIAALVQTVVGAPVLWWTLIALVAITPFVLAGHFVAIMASPKLRPIR